MYLVSQAELSSASHLLWLAKHSPCSTYIWHVLFATRQRVTKYVRYYEIIKEMYGAILLIDGWKALNHECLFTYLKERKQDLELDFDYLLELKDIHNSIGYRGVRVTYSLWDNNKLGVELAIRGLQEYLEVGLE